MLEENPIGLGLALKRDGGFESGLLTREPDGFASPSRGLHSAMTSEGFAAEVKSETIAITHPGKFG